MVNLQQSEGLECESQLKYTRPVLFGSFISCISKRTIKTLMRVIDGFKTNKVYYTDTDS